MLEFFADIDWSDVTQAGIDTLIMLGWSLGFTVLFGLPLGIVLYLTGQPQLLHAPRLYRLLSLCVNVLRSLPFIILLIVMIPVTTLITGTSLGVQGTIPPLVAGCAPFFARLVESALREVDHGLVEASWSACRRHRYRDFAGGLHLYGRGYRRRRARRSGDSFWLPALSDRRDGGHRPAADCPGADFTDERRPPRAVHEP